MMENKYIELSESNVVERKHLETPRPDGTKSAEGRNQAGGKVHYETSYPRKEELNLLRGSSSEVFIRAMSTGTKEETVRIKLSGELKRTHSDERSSREQLDAKKHRGGEASHTVTYKCPENQLGQSEALEALKITDRQMKMAVINIHHPDVIIGRSDSDSVQAEIERSIDELPIGGFSPQFQGTRFENGVLWVTCANVESKDWLVKTVEGLEPLREGGKLKVVGADNLPKRSRVLVWIPGSSAEEETIRARLKIQNPTLMTEFWRPLSRKVVEKGQTVAFSIDQKSFSVLRELDFRPYWGLGRLTFKDLAKTSQR